MRGGWHQRADRRVPHEQLERVLDAGGVNEICSQSTAIQWKERVQNQRRAAGGRHLEAERAVDDIVPDVRNVGGIQCTAKRCVIGDNAGEVKLAVTYLQLRYEIRGEGNTLGHPIIEAESPEHGIVLLLAGMVQVAGVQVGGEITKARIEDQYCAARKFARAEEVFFASGRKTAIDQKCEGRVRCLSQVYLRL